MHIQSQSSSNKAIMRSGREKNRPRPKGKIPLVMPSAVKAAAPVCRHFGALLPPDPLLAVGPYWAVRIAAGRGAGGPVPRPTLGGLFAPVLETAAVLWSPSVGDRGASICICPFGRLPFFCFSRAAACRLQVSCGAGEVPAAPGLDSAGARIGAGWMQFGSAEGLLAGQFWNVAWALPLVDWTVALVRRAGMLRW
ncbi:hypothetical protein NDU88_003888 [Pleurodeles waltl]|uniref:Uncharacterized protein n=1 Tax=Pleurodeles waltl TaxID=8319 RepID=A0AAV7M4P6_PLEWA|nr:hypothetical protein NDU88_003888 [Pleurodeles waltl]